MYFRVMLIGFFEGIESERGIAWRVADSLCLREFLQIGLDERTPDLVTHRTSPFRGGRPGFSGCARAAFAPVVPLSSVWVSRGSFCQAGIRGGGGNNLIFGALRRLAGFCISTPLGGMNA